MIEKMMGFWADDSGATAVDYATVAALAAVGLFGVVDIMGQDAIAALAWVSSGADVAGTGSGPLDCGLICDTAK